MRLTAVVLVSLLAITASCAKKTAVTVAPRIGTTESGVASWYGVPYHGRQTASGEIYDMNDLTAAHPNFAFGVWVRVKNLDNDREVSVRVNDRGPFVGGRIIDLSRAAAGEIDMVRSGIAKVRLRVIAPPSGARVSLRYGVQVASLQERDRAEELRRRLERDRIRPAVVSQGSEDRWRVVAGAAADRETALKLLETLRPTYPDAFVISWNAER
ncbi:MAG: septal ring lytic transglycosylase RlpA family protein [Bryobacteraceae bacterium]|nr:septal ring lytic transglycosylase RlpA family protein [Bryobacteraceae bacterium]